MGREIRMVPAGWEHPRRPSGSYEPLRDGSFALKSAEWKDGLTKWASGLRPGASGGVWVPLASHPRGDRDYMTGEWWEYKGPPPDRAHYRPDWPDADCTWYQVYETVSEGTPVSPAFSTEEALIAHLVAHGDDWSEIPYDADSAAMLVDDGYMPSAVFTRGHVVRPEHMAHAHDGGA